MPSSRPLNALNGTAAKSGASQPQPPMKQPMSRISSIGRDWNDEPQPSQNSQRKPNLSQDTDPFPWSRSPSPKPKPNAGAPAKAPTVSRTSLGRATVVSCTVANTWPRGLWPRLLTSDDFGFPLFVLQREKPVHGTVYILVCILFLRQPRCRVLYAPFFVSPWRVVSI
jgi:hypothetical protein